MVNYDVGLVGRTGVKEESEKTTEKKDVTVVPVNTKVPKCSSALEFRPLMFLYTSFVQKSLTLSSLTLLIFPEAQDCFPLFGNKSRSVNKGRTLHLDFTSGKSSLRPIVIKNTL